MKKIMYLMFFSSALFAMHQEESQPRFHFPIVIAGIAVKTRVRQVSLSATDTSVTLNGNHFDISTLAPGTYIFEGTTLTREETQESDNS